MPETIADPAEMQARARAWRAEGRRIAFVPTMGYLHDGHARLLAHARALADRLVLSIFVNPTQFGPNEDFERYPRDIARDVGVAEREGVDAVFVPTREAIYPTGYSTYVEVGGVADPLEGERRPGHFRGVATVVLKLFQCVQPHLAVFGEKDWQQLAVIRRMTADLHLPVEIVGHPIVREPDGLALSSRNVYLSPDERARAVSLSRALAKAEAMRHGGERSASRLVHAATQEILGSGPDVPIAIDYVALVDPDRLTPLDDAGDRALLALAVRVGKTRLIDNRVLRAVRPSGSLGASPAP